MRNAVRQRSSVRPTWRTQGFMSENDAVNGEVEEVACAWVTLLAALPRSDDEDAVIRPEVKRRRGGVEAAKEGKRAGADVLAAHAGAVLSRCGD